MTPLDRGARVRLIAVRNLTLEVEPATDSSGRGAALGGTAALLAAALLALAGCGGDDTSASDEYANDACSTLSGWVTDVEETVTSLTDQGLSINQDDLQAAVDQTKESTDALVNDLQNLGPPDSEAGNEAKSQLDQLGTTIQGQITEIEQALDSGGGLAAIAATVSTAVATAANAVNDTLQNLEGLDPPGEVRDAFENSDECNSLQDQIANLRSG
jgi:methyl-accepting chemotaxis protein